MIRIFEVRCFVFLSNFVVQYGSTVGMVLSAIICGHRAVSAGKLTGKLALMPECGPPSSWRRRPECECWGKAVRRSVISSDAIFRLYRDTGRTS